MENVVGPESETSQKGFPIVGIGASAGGLAAFEAFFSGMPAETDPGMAFVLVQHLAPDHKSILTDLIRRYTRMQVFEVEDEMVVQPNCAYIIPPGCDMAFLNGSLRLLEPTAPRGQRLPIDFFFRSLAVDQHEKAICIVLSGTGSDGTLGLRAIKGEGGMAMAQSPNTTEYAATGLVDYELSPSEMPAALMLYAAHALGNPSLDSPPKMKEAETAIKKIFVLLRSQTGHDFSLFKPSTINRRIERRMAILHIEAIADYVKYLEGTQSEVTALFRDLLIGVTSFFRDPEVFKALEERIIPLLTEGKNAGDVMRIWSPGCSTGEEAYTLAILFRERQDALKTSFRVLLFATDIDNQAIAAARAGLYPESIASDLSKERLSRFFTADPAGGSYRINKDIRDMVVFSEQDLIKDPPFSRLDLISCRNLLIYMGSELQKKLIPLFHYALNPDGILFLGTSETVGEFGDLFDVVDGKSKLYRSRKALNVPQSTDFVRYQPSLADPTMNLPRAEVRTGRSTKPPLRELTEQALLQQIAPAAALVNAQGDILYLHGRTGMYLEPSPGEAGVENILKMARDGLRHSLTIALRKASHSKQIVRFRGLLVKTNSHFTEVNLTVNAIPASLSRRDIQGGAIESENSLFLVLLEDALPGGVEVAGQILRKTEGGPISELEADAHVEALMQELRAKEEYIQTANEELESSNEELKSSNEEMQSVNEELQSTNEELETSKEELQSVNEELATVNAELQIKVADLSQANNDMNNLLAGTGIGTVFVDHSLRILRFTPAATKVINLIKSDIGRPVAHVASNLVDYDRLVPDSQAVLDSLVPREVEVLTTGARWYSMRIQPYRTLENVIEGAVLTFVDITDIKKAQDELHVANEQLRRLAAVVRDSNDAITVQDLEGRILAWNPGAERNYGWSEAEALAMNILDLVPEDQRDEALTRVRQLSKRETLEPYRTRRIAKDGKIVEVWLTATALINDSGNAYAIETTEREIGRI